MPHLQLVDIRSESLNHYEQVLALLDSLQQRGSYGIGSLYLSLRETSDEMYGTPTHYQLAFELKSISKCCLLLVAAAVDGCLLYQFILR